VNPTRIRRLIPSEQKLFQPSKRFTGSAEREPRINGLRSEIAEVSLAEIGSGDLRYDFGRVAEVSGAAEIARAQADSILSGDPTHLLGLVLAVRAAQLRGDSTAARTFARRLLAAEPSESAKKLPEYERHQGDILEALAEARRR